MLPTGPSELEQFEHPIVIEHLRLDETVNGFVPSARLLVTQAARTSGLLRKLTGNQSRILLVMISYLTPNGHVHVTAHQIGKALGVPTPVAAVWLLRFCKVKVKKAPIILKVHRPVGHDYYTLSHSIIKHAIQPPIGHQPIIHRVVSREDIIDHTRRNYANHVDGVEVTVIQQLGHNPEELPDTPEAAVWQELHYLKFNREDIKLLIEIFGVESIQQQIDWLPGRPGKNRARTLVSAMLNDLGPPKKLKDVLENVRRSRQQTRLTNSDTGNPGPTKGDHEQ